MLRLVLCSVITFAFVSGSAIAQQPPKKEMKQHRRIEQGVRSGALTQEEAQTLKDEQKTVRQLEEKAKSDGVVTKEEKEEIRAARKQANRHIYEEKHDADKK